VVLALVCGINLLLRPETHKLTYDQMALNLLACLLLLLLFFFFRSLLKHSYLVCSAFMYLLLPVVECCQSIWSMHLHLVKLREGGHSKRCWNFSVVKNLLWCLICVCVCVCGVRVNLCSHTCMLMCISEVCMSPCAGVQRPEALNFLYHLILSRNANWT
jgi:hypothetical protein